MNPPHHPPAPFLLLWLMLSALLLAGCQSQISEPYSSGLSDPAYARSALYEQYQEWKGVPYRDGGESRWGLIVLVLFSSLFVNSSPCSCRGIPAVRHSSDVPFPPVSCAPVIWSFSYRETNPSCRGNGGKK